MTTVQVFQAIGASCFLLTSVVVGGRLIVLSKRNRGLPELLLGVSFLLGTMGAVLEAGGQPRPGFEDPLLLGRIQLIAKISVLLGMAVYAAFICRVFRPGERWATVLATALIGTLALAIAGYMRAGAFGMTEAPGSWFWIELCARLGLPSWLCIEAFRYHTLMRRRLALGLADPIVANRFLLWGSAGVISMLLICTSIPPRLVPQGSWIVELDLALFGVLGVVAAVPYGLAFFPPEWYRRWIAGRAPQAAAN